MTSLEGVDVSRWQTTTPTSGKSFVFAKATEGTGYADPEYHNHASRTISAGLRLGAYHWARDEAGIDAQALWFLQHAIGATALAVDNEQSHGLSRGDTRLLIASIKGHDVLHRPVGLYMALDDTWVNDKGQHCGPFYTDVGADFYWPARWGAAKPLIPWSIWQYSNSGGHQDLDVAADLASLAKVFGGPHPTPAPHFAAVVTTPTNLWNDTTHKWVYNGRSIIKFGTRLVIRGAQYDKGGVPCYPIVGPLYAGYYVPVAHVHLGAKVP